MDISSFLTYLEHNARKSKHTVSAYRRDLLLWQKFVEDLELTAQSALVSSKIIREHLADLRYAGLSARTVNRHLSAIKAYYNWLCRQIPDFVNPADEVDGVKASTSLPVVAPQVELNELLLNEEGEFAADQARIIVLLLYSTGIRRAELLGLKWSDVDFEAGTLRVLGKRNKQRLVPVIPQALDALKHWQNSRSIAAVSTQDYVIVNRKGEKADPKLVYRAVNSYLRTIPNMARKSPHVMRHTFATHLLNSGADLNLIKEILGHASLASTQVYTHVGIDRLKDAHRRNHPRS